VASAHPTLALAKGIPGAGSADPRTVIHTRYDATKAARILGIGHEEDEAKLEVRYQTLEETARDVLVDARVRGWD
jgi:hypothetical protein